MHGGCRLTLDLIDRHSQRLFLRQFVQPGIRRAVERALVLLLLDREDVTRPLGPRKQVLAVVAVEEFAERLDATDHHQEVVLAAEREHGIDEIVTRALISELDLQAVGEERQKIARKPETLRPFRANRELPTWRPLKPATAGCSPRSA